MSNTEQEKTVLKHWWDLSTMHEQEALAQAAGTSRAYLQQLALGYRSASSDVAGRIEEGAKRITRMSKGRLPRLTRADISPACAECPYAKRCIAAKQDD